MKRRRIRWSAITLLLCILLFVQGCEKKMSVPAPRDEHQGESLASKPTVTAFRIAPPAGGLVGTQDTPDRKVIRIAHLQLLVEDVSKAADQIQGLAQKYGGYVESTEISQSKGSTASGRITIRVPARRLDEARSELKRLARLAEIDKTEARDVTKEFVDNEARLRNYQAEERQYLEIMRRATKVEDTLNIAEHLSDVRGRIEELQAELKYLSQQVEMASVAVALRVESVAQASEWRPWYQTKLAFADMVEGLANFADFVVYFLLMLPVILLWTLAVVFAFGVGVKLFLWLKRKLWPRLTRTLKTSEAKN